MLVISSSIVPPNLKFEPISRQDLVDLLPRVSASRVTSVSAPAGFGKTAAMRFWAQELEREGRPVIWIAARAGFTGTEQFLAAITKAAEVKGFTWQGTASELVPSMLHELTGAPLKPVLVIDDAQFLPEEVIALVSSMISNARDGLTTILSTRGRSPMPVARLRSLGCLVEVEAAHLRFTREENADLVQAANSTNRAWADLAYDHLAGWPAGTTMLSRLPAPSNLEAVRSDPAIVRLIAHLKEYFDQEVFASVPPALADFLADLSIFEEFGREEALAVTGQPNSGQHIEQLLDLGLFLEPVETEMGRYRFYPFFRELLHDRLMDRDVCRARELHRRAATHYLKNGQALLAVQQADASNDLPFLAQTLDGVAEQLTYEGEIITVVQLADKLPWKILSEHSGIMLCMAWRQIRALSFEAAEELLDAVDADLQRLRELPDSDAARTARLDRLLRHRRALLLGARDDMPAVEEASEELLAAIGDDNAYVSCTLLAQLMAARRELFHFQDTMKLEAQTRKALGRSGSQFASIALKAAVAPTLALQGKTAAARQLLEEALAMAERYQGPNSGLAALPALPLAELCYETGDLPTAQDLINRHLGHARVFGYTDQLCAGYLVKARLLAAEGEISGALAALDEAQLVALECGLERLRIVAVAQKVQILLREDQRDAAMREFLAAGLDPEGEPIPTMTPRRTQEAAAIAWIRLAMREHRLGRARKIAQRWLDLVKRNGASRSVVQFDLILAEIALLSGDLSEARRHVRSAVTLSAEPCWTRIFTDGGEVIGRLLQEAYGNGPLVDTPTDRFAARLLEHFGLQQAVTGPECDLESGLGDRIADREIEILVLVENGLRNREIGNRLGLTEGTVKWYMQQIYDKLGVRRRPQAVMRARALGLLT